MSGSPSTSTTTSNNAPPAEFLQAYQNVNNQAQGVAATPYSPYTGNVVAPFAPGQIQGMQQVQDLTANGGVQQPYLDAATKSLLNAQTPLWDNVNQFSSDAVNQYQSPYTKAVVDATQNQFNNANAIQQQQVIGDAIGKGAWGGDRSAVAQAITAGQQQLAQAPVIAGLENQGYTQALGEFNNQQAAELGANEANAWLGSQAGALFGNLGQEAQSTGLTAANANLGIGGLQQGMGQALLNVPQEQYIAAQAYPFQTTGWLANIAEGLGGASGGNSSTTVPGPSTASQVAGLGLGAAGIAGQAGAFKGLGTSIGNAFSGTGNAAADAGGLASASDLATLGSSGVYEQGGMVPARAPGGSVPDVSLSIIPQATGLGASPITAPTSPDAIVPGASGMGASPATHGTQNILKNYGQTATTTPHGGDSTIGSLLQTAGQIAAGIYGGPAGAAAAGALNSQVNFAEGGRIPKRAVGGMAASAEVPSWARAAASGMDRHGLLASPVAGRTDQLAISPAAGSYVVPADVVSGLGEGNTLAGANIMQRILDTGPHGLKMPVSSHNHMGPPRAPPAYNENTEHISNTSRLVPNARGGKIQKRAVGGYTSLQDFIGRDMSQPTPAAPSTNPTTAAITNAFQTDLGRAPTPADLSYYTGQVQGGSTLPAQLNSIAASPDAQAYQKSQGDVGAITSAFQNSLGRAPTPADIAYYQGQVQGGSPLADQLRSIGASPEAQGRGAITSAFQNNLGRGPTPADMSYYMGQIAQGSSPADQANSIAMSPGANAFKNVGTGINASTGTGVSQTGMPALDNYLNNVMKGANYTRPTSGGMTPSSPQSIADAVTKLLASQPAQSGAPAAVTSPNSSPATQALLAGYAANPQANPSPNTLAGLASGGMVPRRAEGGPADETLDLDVDSTPPLVIPPQPGPSIPGGLYAAAASAAPAALGMTPALHEQISQHAIPGNRVGSYVPPPPEYASLVQEAAARHGVDPKPLAWLLSTESHWNPKAYNPSSHTMGMGQFKAATAKEVGIDPWNPAQAIDGSAKYLRQMLDKHGDYEHAIARYGTFSTGHGPEADNAVRGQYRAFMQGAKRGGMVKFADGGMTGATDDLTPEESLALGIPPATLPDTYRPRPSTRLPVYAPHVPVLPKSMSNAELKAVAAGYGDPDAMPRRVPATLPPPDPAIAAAGDPDAQPRRVPVTARQVVNPEGGPTTLAVKENGPPPPPVVTTSEESTSGATDAGSNMPAPPVPGHAPAAETPGDGSYTDPHGLKVNPWEALTTAGFAMAAGRSPHALENIGAGGLAGMKSYQAQRQLAIQDQMRIDQAKTNALWRMKQGDLGDEKNAISRMRGNAYVQNMDALAGLHSTQAENVPLQRDINQQNANTREAAVAVQQQRVNYMKLGMDEKTAHDKAQEDYNSGRLAVQFISAKKDPITGKSPSMDEAKGATQLPGRAAPTAAPMTPPGLPPGAKLAPDGHYYVPNPAGGWLQAVPTGP